MLWISFAVFVIFGILAIYLGGKGKTKLHRLAAWSGALTIIGLLTFVPVAIYTAASAISSVRDDPLEEAMLVCYLGALVAFGLISVVTSIRLSTRKA